MDPQSAMDPLGLVNKTRSAGVAASWSFDVTTGLWRSNLDGRLLSYQEVRRSVEAVVIGARMEASMAAAELPAEGRDAGSIDTFWRTMLMLIAGIHTAAAAAANGGIPALTLTARQALREAIARDNAYLAGFTSEIRAGLDSATLGPRAASYMDSALVTYEQERMRVHKFLDYTEGRRITHPEAEHCNGCIEQEARGYVPIDEVVPLGSEECGQWCKCTIDYRKTSIQAE